MFQVYWHKRNTWRRKARDHSFQYKRIYQVSDKSFMGITERTRPYTWGIQRLVSTHQLPHKLGGGIHYANSNPKYQDLSEFSLEGEGAEPVSKPLHHQYRNDWHPLLPSRKSFWWVWMNHNAQFHLCQLPYNEIHNSTMWLPRSYLCRMNWVVLIIDSVLLCREASGVSTGRTV